MLPLGEGIVFELELLCEPRAGCGITITGSRSSGIAVKYLHPGGPASQDGRLREGDKLLTIDDQQVWFLTCGQVARYLKQTGPVKLGVFRPDYDYMSLRLGNRGVANCSISSRTSSQSDTLTGQSRLSVTDIETLSSASVNSKRQSFDSSKSRKLPHIVPKSNAFVHTQHENKQAFYYPAISRLRRLFNLLSNKASHPDNCEPSAIPSSPTKYNMFRNSRSTCSMMTDSDSPEIISELNSSASSYELIKHEKY